MGKGSGRRPGSFYETNWDRIFGSKEVRLEDLPPENRVKPTYEELEAQIRSLKGEIEYLQSIISKREGYD